MVACSQRSPEAITEGRKWNYARLPVGLSQWLGSGQRGSLMPQLLPSEPCLLVEVVEEEEVKQDRVCEM